MSGTIRNNVMLAGKHRRRFGEIFGVELKEYFDTFTGFDVVRFDMEFVKPRRGQSTADCLKAKYGQEAHDLVHNLIMGV